MKLIPTNYQVLMTPMTFSRSWGQSSRSGSDGHGNLVNATTAKQLKKTEPKPCTNTCHTQVTNWLASQSNGVKYQGHRATATYRNILNFMACGSLKGFEPKFMKILLTLGPRTEHPTKAYTDWRFVVKHHTLRGFNEYELLSCLTFVSAVE